MRKDLGKRALAGLLAAAAMLAVASSSARAGAAERTVSWYGLGGCREPVLLVPTDFENVKPYVPPGQWANVLTVAVGGREKATLIFTLNSCPENTVVSWQGDYSTGEVVEVIVGVLYRSRRPGEDGEFQFYTLRSFTNWSHLDSAFTGIGLPSTFLPGIRYELSVDPVTRLGSYVVEVPWGPGPFTVEGRVVEGPLETHGDAGQFYDGPHGLVKVAHHAELSVGTSTGTVTAKANSLVANVIGGTAKDGTGGYWHKDDVEHIHRAEIVD